MVLSPELVDASVPARMCLESGFTKTVLMTTLRTREIELVLITISTSGAEYTSPKKRSTVSIMVGLYKPTKVKGYLLSH